MIDGDSQMSKASQMAAAQVSKRQMKEAIQRSGYLLEQRVERILTEMGYFVQTNSVFPDTETGKSRGIDISAINAVRVYRGWNYVFPVLLCECENNSQPIVFFTRESPISFLHYQEVKVSGIPVKFRKGGNYIDFLEFTKMERFHHYCKGVTATQYCTFQFKKDRSCWMALHSEEQHDTFNSLIKALEYEIAKHFDQWVLPEKGEEEAVNVQIYYPIVILQGDLYSASVETGRLTMRKSKHVQFRKELFLSRANDVETYQIDVISESYLPSYLRIVDSEMGKIKKILQSRKKEVLFSIKRIVEQAMVLKKKPNSYREFLEF